MERKVRVIEPEALTAQLPEMLPEAESIPLALLPMRPGISRLYRTMTAWRKQK